MPTRERFRICEVPQHAHFFRTPVLLMPSRPRRVFPTLMLQNCCAVIVARWELRKGYPAASQRYGAG
jgi:hypothetical protein